MDIREKVPVIKVAIRGANGRMGLQAIYASMENNESILERAKNNELRDDDVWIDIVFGAFTSDIPTVQQLLAGVLRSEKSKILEGYDKNGIPIFRVKPDGKPELRTKYVEQTLDEEPQRNHVISYDRQEIVDTPEGLPAIKIYSRNMKDVLSVIHHANIRLGELSAEAIMDRVLDRANSLGANVLLSCVGDTAKKADRMMMWLDKIHQKKYPIGFIESAPAKGWESRMLSRQDQISVLCSRNASPTGTLFRTGIALSDPLFDYNQYELGKACRKFAGIFTRIIENVLKTPAFSSYAQILKKKPKTIREIDGQSILINFPPEFLAITSPNYLTFSFYEDNEYGYICAALIPNIKALGLLYRDGELVNRVRENGLKYDAFTNIPGIFGIDWFKAGAKEVIGRGGALSTSSCTTNGNVVADFIVFLSLYCYFDLFYKDIKGSYTCTDKAKALKFDEVIERSSPSSRCISRTSSPTALSSSRRSSGSTTTRFPSSTPTCSTASPGPSHRTSWTTCGKPPPVPRPRCPRSCPCQTESSPTSRASRAFSRARSPGKRTRRRRNACRKSSRRWPGASEPSRKA